MPEQFERMLDLAERAELERLRSEAASLRAQLEQQERMLADERAARARVEQAAESLRQQLITRAAQQALELEHTSADLLKESHARSQTEAWLSTSRNLLQAIVDNIPGFIFIKDLDGRLLVFNERFAELFGLPPTNLTGHTEAEFFPPEQVARWRADDLRVMMSRTAIQYEDEVITASGRRYYFTTKFPITDASGRLVAIGAVVTDVSAYREAENERLQMEERLRETQRLESLGVLAGGIAHDFNNILTGLMGYADLALLDLPSDSPAVSSLVEIVSGIRRASELTGQMLAYSGKGKFVMTTASLADLVREMTNFVRISIPKKVDIYYSYAADLPPVVVDATQIRQVILNLILNAAEAIGEQHGQVHVRIGTAPADDPRLATAPVRAGHVAPTYVFLEVSDTGQGMTPDILARLFDPFFTTKFTGRGLGMSVVLGIMRGHDGAIAVQTEPGYGSTITVFLPAAQVAEERVIQRTPSPNDGRRRVVLVVDDEPQVLAIAQRMIERLGYTALTAATPDEALALYRSEHERVDCVLLDLTMPEMDGVELFRAMAKVSSHVRAVLCSGYSEQYASERFVDLDLAGFLPKPYRIDDLRHALIDAMLK